MGDEINHLFGHLDAVQIDVQAKHHMVQAGKINVHAVGINAKQLGDAHAHADRHVAQPDHFFLFRVAQNGFCHHPSRVREVDQPCIGAKLFHIANDVQNDRNRPQSLKQSARAVCLLADHPVFERDALVFRPCL